MNALTRGEATTVHGRRLGFRAHLIALVLAVLLPALGLGAITAWHMAQNYRDAFGRRLLDTAHALSLAVDREIAVNLEVVAALASSPLLRRGDLSTFRSWASGASARLGGWVVVNDVAAGHQQILNTGLPEGAPLPSVSLPGEGAWSLITRVIETGRPAVSDLFEGRATGRKVVAVAAPALDSAGRVAHVVVLTVDPGRLSQLLADQGLSGGAIAGMADGGGRIIARSYDSEAFLGAPAPAWYQRRIAGQEAGLFSGPTADGTPALVGFHRVSSASSWSVIVAEPLAAHQASWRNPLLGLVVGGALTFALSLLLAWVLAQRLLRPISSLVRRAEAVASSGEVGFAGPQLPAALPSQVTEFEALRLAAERAGWALQTSEAEFRAAFEQSSVPMSQVDCATGELLRVNAAYCALLDRSATALVGRPFSDFVHPDDREADLEGFRRMCRGEAPGHRVRKRYVRPDGSARWVELTSSPVRDPTGRWHRTVAVAIDVTERHEAEMALREGEARLHLALDAGRMMVWEADLATGAVRGSPELNRLLGFPLAASLTLDDIRARYYPGERERLQQITHDLLARGERFGEAEIRYVRPDGLLLWIMVRAEFLINEAGQPVRYVGVVMDVTERKQAEEALRESEERLRLAQESSGIGIYNWDIRVGAISWSPEMYRLHGISPATSPERLYEAWLERLHPEDRERADHETRTFLERQGPLQIEFRVVLPDGQVRWILGRGTVERDAQGRAVRMMGVNLDLTELREAERALREGEEIQRLSMQAGRVGAFRRDIRANLVRCSAETRIVHGVPPGDGPIPFREWIAAMLPEDRERVQAEIGAAVAARVPERSYEYRIRALNSDATRHIETRTSYQYDATGQPVSAVGVLIDVTDRKRAEEQRELLMREVDHRAKNALAVVEAALRLTPKDDPKAYSRSVEGRVKALARAHTLLAEDRWSGADLHTLLRGELEPFLGEVDGGCQGAEGGPKATLDGPAVILPPGAAQPLAMAVHELATNAVKYGALSAPAGHLAVSWAVRPGQQGQSLRLRWKESGGPALQGEPGRRGFGTRVLDGTIRRQLGGALRLDWRDAGLVCELLVPLERLPGSSEDILGPALATANLKKRSTV